MKKYMGIWYNLTQEVKRDIVLAENDEDAKSKLYELYDGESPAELLSVIALT